MTSWWATPYDAHPNEAAAGLAAERLAEHLTGVIGAGGNAAADRHQP
jgi:hypothetical protein